MFDSQMLELFFGCCAGLSGLRYKSFCPLASRKFVHINPPVELRKCLSFQGLIPRNYRGLANVPIEHHPIIGDINYKNIFEGDVQTPQKGTFTNPCSYSPILHRFRPVRREFLVPTEGAACRRLNQLCSAKSGLSRV